MFCPSPDRELVTNFALHLLIFFKLRRVNSLALLKPWCKTTVGFGGRRRVSIPEHPKLCKSAWLGCIADLGCTAPPKAQDEQHALSRSQVWRQPLKAKASAGAGGGVGGSLALPDKMAAALTPSYVLLSQPCPHHLTAGNGGRSAAGPPGDSEGRGAQSRSFFCPTPASGRWEKSRPIRVSRRPNDFPQPSAGRRRGSLCAPPGPLTDTARLYKTKAGGGVGAAAPTPGLLSPCSVSSLLWGHAGGCGQREQAPTSHMARAWV